MKVIKITTHWSPEQAEDIYRLLDELKSAVWQSYGDDIIKMHLDDNKDKKNDDESF